MFQQPVRDHETQGGLFRAFGTFFGNKLKLIYPKSPSFVYLCWLLVILLDVLKCTPASILCRRLDLLL